MCIIISLMNSCDCFKSKTDCNWIGITVLLFYTEPRLSLRASPTSWWAAMWALWQKVPCYSWGFMGRWRSCSWTETKKWRCSRCYTNTAVGHNSTAASPMASAMSLSEESCWTTHCWDSRPCTGLQTLADMRFTVFIMKAILSAEYHGSRHFGSL